MITTQINNKNYNSEFCKCDTWDFLPFSKHTGKDLLDLLKCLHIHQTGTLLDKYFQSGHRRPPCWPFEKSPLMTIRPWKTMNYTPPFSRINLKEYIQLG